MPILIILLNYFIVKDSIINLKARLCRKKVEAVQSYSSKAKDVRKVSVPDLYVKNTFCPLENDMFEPVEKKWGKKGKKRTKQRHK